MAYIVCHAEKQNNLMSMPHHIDRIGAYQEDGSVTVYPDDYVDETLRGELKHPQLAHPKLYKWNRGGGATYDKFSESWREEIVKLERSPQKNASQTVCFNNSAGEEFWVELRNNYPKDEDYYSTCEEYFYDCRVALDELYPYGKTLKWTTHYEEKEPHMHCLKIPILKAPKRLSKKDKAKKKKRGEAILKFSSGEFLGGPKGLVRLQDAIYEKVGRKWGLERGERGSDARHTDQLEWQRKLSLKDKELTEGLKITNEIRDKNNRDSEELTALKAKIKKQESEVVAEKRRLIKEGQEAAKKIKEAEDEIKIKAELILKREKAVEKREKAVSSNEHFVKSVDKAITDMKNRLSGEDRISVSVLEVLNAEGVSGEERKIFFKEFFRKIPDFVRDIIKTIRNKPEKEVEQKETKIQTNEKNGKIKSGLVIVENL